MGKSFPKVILRVNGNTLYVYCVLGRYTSSLGLFKKHRLWKFKAGRVVSHVFRHVEFNGVRENRFQALLGVAKII